MGCPPVSGDNPQALTRGLSYVQVDNHGITIYTTFISVDLARHEIFRAKVGKGGIKPYVKYGQKLRVYHKGLDILLRNFQETNTYYALIK